VVNTNGRADHIGGNEILRKAGSQIIAGEERQAALGFGTAGAALGTPVLVVCDEAEYGSRASTTANSARAHRRKRTNTVRFPQYVIRGPVYTCRGLTARAGRPGRSIAPASD